MMNSISPYCTPVKAYLNKHSAEIKAVTIALGVIFILGAVIGHFRGVGTVGEVSLFLTGAAFVLTSAFFQCKPKTVTLPEGSKLPKEITIDFNKVLKIDEDKVKQQLVLDGVSPVNDMSVFLQTKFSSLANTKTPAKILIEFNEKYYTNAFVINAFLAWLKNEIKNNVIGEESLQLFASGLPKDDLFRSHFVSCCFQNEIFFTKYLDSGFVDQFTKAMYSYAFSIESRRQYIKSIAECENKQLLESVFLNFYIKESIEDTAKCAIEMIMRPFSFEASSIEDSKLRSKKMDELYAFAKNLVQNVGGESLCSKLKEVVWENISKNTTDTPYAYYLFEYMYCKEHVLWKHGEESNQRYTHFIKTKPTIMELS